MTNETIERTNETCQEVARPGGGEVHVRRGERGSAYLIALMALVVLTILGLSLVLVTQTEVQVGANERTVNRTFYAADSGFHIITAEALANNTYVAPPFNMNEVAPGSVGGKVADIVKVTPFSPVSANSLDSHICAYCPANESGPKYYTKAYQLTSTAGRVAWTSGSTPTDPTNLPLGATELGEKTLSMTIQITPAKDPPTTTIQDTTLLQKVKF
jgi:Tfp pilus assembly protein PilX